VRVRKLSGVQVAELRDVLQERNYHVNGMEAQIRGPYLEFPEGKNRKQITSLYSDINCTRRKKKTATRKAKIPVVMFKMFDIKYFGQQTLYLHKWN
jgi:hypothetical protein